MNGRHRGEGWPMIRWGGAALALFGGVLACKFSITTGGITPAPTTNLAPSRAPSSTPRLLATVAPSPTLAPTRTPVPPTATNEPVTRLRSTAEPSELVRMILEHSGPTPRPSDRKSTSIAFVSQRDGIMDIYRVNEDGSGEIRLTQNHGDNEEPAWSADGKHIAFLRWEAVTDDGLPITRLYVMDQDGANQVELAAQLEGIILRFAWSPRSSRLVLVGVGVTIDAFGAQRVMVVNWDGSGLRGIFSTGAGVAGCSLPSWSPDDTMLASACRGLMQVQLEIKRVDSRGFWGGGDYGQVDRVLWLPSGRHLGLIDGMCDIGVISVDVLLKPEDDRADPFECLIRDFDPLGVDWHGPSHIAWSPVTDTRLAIQDRDGLQVVDLASYEVITANFPASELNGPPSWSADGMRIAFAADGGEDLEIFVLDLERDEVIQLTNNEFDDHSPAWQP